MVLEALKKVQTDFALLPSSKVAICSGGALVMDRARSFRMHIRPEELAQLDSGMDLTYSGRGPAHIFCLVELMWLDQTDSTGETKRAWTVVHFPPWKARGNLMGFVSGT